METQQNVTKQDTRVRIYEDIPIEALKPNVGLFDVMEYLNKPIAIGKIEVITAYTDRDVVGNTIEGLQRPIPRLKVSTEPLAVIDRPGAPIELRASELFGLMETQDGVTWSKNASSDLNKFMIRYGVTHPKDLIGKQVVTTLRKGKYLGFYRE